MPTHRIGIQGDLGSTNHRAARCFVERHGWPAAEIVPLQTSWRVLEALAEGAVDLGTMAWATRGGPVEESHRAAEAVAFERVDTLRLMLDHALLARTAAPPDASSPVSIRSHPQALAEHEAFLRGHFDEAALIEADDTALAAQRLAEGAYPDGSLVIAPRECAARYGLHVCLDDLPSNDGYWVQMLLIKRAGSP